MVSFYQSNDALRLSKHVPRGSAIGQQSPERDLKLIDNNNEKTRAFTVLSSIVFGHRR
jgi:hypothetical protein